MNKKYELYFDMDGVLYPLNETIISQYNKDYNENYDWRNNTQFNWQDTKGSPEYFINLINSKNTFIKGKPYNDVIEFVNKLYDEGFIIKIITFPLWNNYCINEKVEYLKKYFSKFNPDTDMVATGSKWLCAAPHRILIDDNIHNIVEWRRHNGIAIPFESHGNMCYDNQYRFNSIKQVYKTIHMLNDNNVKTL